jgi:hypothetical protein
MTFTWMKVVHVGSACNVGLRQIIWKLIFRRKNWKRYYVMKRCHFEVLLLLWLCFWFGFYVHNNKMLIKCMGHNRTHFVIGCCVALGVQVFTEIQTQWIGPGNILPWLHVNVIHRALPEFPVPCLTLNAVIGTINLFVTDIPLGEFPTHVVNTQG